MRRPVASCGVGAGHGARAGLGGAADLLMRLGIVRHVLNPGSILRSSPAPWSHRQVSVHGVRLLTEAAVQAGFTRQGCADLVIAAGELKRELGGEVAVAVAHFCEGLARGGHVAREEERVDALAPGRLCLDRTVSSGLVQFVLLNV